MEFGRNSNRRFAVKNKEIKQIIFSRKKNKKWIIIALVLVLTLKVEALTPTDKRLNKPCSF